MDFFSDCKMALTRLQQKKRKKIMRALQRAKQRLERLTDLDGLLDGFDGTEINNDRAEGMIVRLEEELEYMDELPEMYHVRNHIEVLRHLTFFWLAWQLKIFCIDLGWNLNNTKNDNIRSKFDIHDVALFRKIYNRTYEKRLFFWKECIKYLIKSIFIQL